MKTATKVLFGLMWGVLLLSFLAGCGGGGDGGPALVSLEVTPTRPSLALGTTAQFAATGVFSDHTRKDLTSSVTWSSANGNATISNTAGSKGLATATVAGGSTTITATLGGVTGSTTLTVAAATLQLIGIGVTPTNPSIARGTTQQFAATGTFSDGTTQTTQDLTTQVTWSSSDITGTNVATISNTAGSNGLATAVTAGSATITATLTIAGSTVSGSTTLTVTPATLRSVEVTPTNPTITSGTTQQFKATGIFNDNSKQDLTGSVTWSSLNHAAATIGSGGLATGAGAGTSTITASFGSKSGSTTLTVTAAPLVAIEVSPLNPGIALGTGLQFTAIGRFADNTTQNLTTAVTWTSLDKGVATISNATGSNGLATPVAAGTTTIAAISGGVSGSTLLTVKDNSVTLTSIDVEPATPSVPVGAQQPFTAMGTYSDGSTQDLTTVVTWSSDTLGVATISNAAGSVGTALAIAPGSATITATLGSISGSTTLTVPIDVTLSSIEVSPPDTTIPKGLTQSFTAMGFYSDGSFFDLTPVVTWSSLDITGTNVAIVSNDTVSAGLATAVNPGTATITATLGTTSGSTSLTVTSATLKSIAVTPVSPSIALGTTQQFVATGSYSDNSTRDITQFVTWISTVPSVASISNVGNQKGLATGVKAGTTVIRAASGTIVSADDTLTVTTAALQSITITPPIPPATIVTIATKTSQQFTATGTFSDGTTLTTQDLTRLVTWSSSRTTFAVISNATSSKGVATGVNPGTTIITAAYASKSGTATLTVAMATLTDLTILPANPAPIAVGSTQQFQAIGTYSNGPVTLFTQDLTKAVKWSSTDKSIAAASNGFNSRGLITGVGAGSATISATKPATAITGSTGITVQ